MTRQYGNGARAASATITIGRLGYGSGGVMSREEWGEFITSRPTPGQCRQAIFELNRLLARMRIPDEIKLGIIFSVYPTFDNVLGRPWYWGVYLTLDERAARAVSDFYSGGNGNTTMVDNVRLGDLLRKAR